VRAYREAYGDSNNKAYTDTLNGALEAVTNPITTLEAIGKNSWQNLGKLAVHVYGDKVLELLLQGAKDGYNNYVERRDDINERLQSDDPIISGAAAADSDRFNFGTVASIGSLFFGGGIKVVGRGDVNVPNNTNAASSIADNTSDISSYTFRGDTRSPDVIFNEGFKPRGESRDLFQHALDNTNPPSAYVSTSKSFDAANDFADNVFVVRPKNGIDVNEVLGSKSPFPHELEIAIPDGVKPSDIRAVTLPEQGVSILNPSYKR